MKVGIVGTATDPQCAALVEALRALDAEPLLLEYGAFERGLPLAFSDASLEYGPWKLDELGACFSRFIPTPYAPAMQRDGEWVLHSDWYTQFVQTRERASFFVSLLLQLERKGVFLVNAPQALAVVQDKPLQLQVLRELGARVPGTLITNDAERVRAFAAQHAGGVIFKPLLGGALTRRLDDEALARLELIRHAPVIFQEAIPGDDVRVMVLGDAVISSVTIVTPTPHLDFREDPVYASGNATYRETPLPPDIERACIAATRACGLKFAGLDVKRTPDGTWVFLELNASPTYLDVEEKMGHRITAALGRYLVERGAGPGR